MDARRTEAGFRFTLCTNGQPPSAPIRETGGLLSLRTLAESQGGNFSIDCLPEVRITITLPVPEPA